MSHACKAHLDRARATLAVFLAMAVLLGTGVASAAPLRERILVPERNNLQLLALWVAEGAGFFAKEGVQMQPVFPSAPALTQEAFARGVAPMAVLPSPMVLRLASEKAPIVVAANLLANDPIDLIVRRSVAEARGLSSDKPLADRLRAMQGMKVGVAPGPPPRLRALFASVGLDADRDVQMVTVAGQDQNQALVDGRVDALYAHTPFLERALVEDDAVVVVDQAGGEVPVLAGRMIHSLVVKAEFAREHPRAVARVVRAIADAEELLRRDPAKAADAVLRVVQGSDRAHVERLVALYAKAVPASPRPSAETLARELAFSPANTGTPDVAPAALAHFVDARFVDMKPGDVAPAAGWSAKTLAMAFAALVALLAAGAAVLAESWKSAGTGDRDTSV
jgi:NitT/TauT family transport system substrate-binding protein